MTVGIAAGALLLAGCSSSDPNDDNHINGLGRADAVIACQKHLAESTPGVSLGDFSAVGSKEIRKIRNGDEYQWTIQSDLDGRSYTCNVRPQTEDDYEVEGAFASL